jgi:serine/threonine protein kinase
MAALPESIGEYKVVKELGRGAMGVVYLAIHPSLGREMAIKVMARELASDPEFLERFRREGEMAAKLRHPHIVQVFDFAQRDGLFFIAMEYLGASTLKDLLQESGQQPVARACEILDQLLSALASAHAKGIVHRDIKPANVMLTDEGSIALTDFSVAHMKESSKLTQTGAVLGTPEYMAPEQFEGSWDHRSDLYSAGILLYELLTGFSPFRCNTITEVMRKQLLTVPDPPSAVDFTLPEAISQVVARSLEKDPEARYQSADEMRKAVQAALAQPTPAVQTAREAPVLTPEPIAAAPSGLVPEIRSKASEQADLLPLRSMGASATPISLPPAEPTKPTPEVSATVGGSVDGAGRRQGKSPLYLIAILILVVGGWWAATRGRERVEPVADSRNTPTVLAEIPATPDSTPAPWESPVAVASLTPEPTPSPLLSPTAVPFVTPSSSPSPLSLPDGPGSFPEVADVHPGTGMGGVNIGFSMDEVLKVWGEPLSKDEMLQGFLWSYGKDGDLSCNLMFDTETKRLNTLAVFDPRFTVNGLTGMGVDAHYDKILEAFPTPTIKSEILLDYNNEGISFGFGSSRDGPEVVRDGICKNVCVYQPGHSDQGPETPLP